MKEMILAVVLFSIALAAFVVSLRSFRCKGFLLNNAFLYASDRDRETMDKKPYYRQSAVVFLLIGINFALNGLAVLSSLYWITYIGTAIVIGTIVYAVTSTVAIEKQQKS